MNPNSFRVTIPGGLPLHVRPGLSLPEAQLLVLRFGSRRELFVRNLSDTNAVLSVHPTSGITFSYAGITLPLDDDTWTPDWARQLVVAVERAIKFPTPH